MRGRFRRGPALVKFPGILEVAMRSALLHSTWREQSAMQEADVSCARPSTASA